MTTDFLSYWVNQGSNLIHYSTPKQTSSSAVVGDFVAFAFKATSKVDHIAFITKKANGIAYYTQQTNSKINENLSTLNGDPYYAYYILKVN